ncbi:hypothetical protein EON65_50405 [archaeon]|nr:MAG: hypothetical protein EON65_50405 [archaeon]
MAELQALFTATSHSNLEEIVASVRERSDIISNAGQTVLSTNTHPTTELLRTIHHVLSNGKFVIPSIAVALQIQSKFLNESCFHSFVFVSKCFFQHVTSKQAMEVYKEGKCKYYTNFLYRLIDIYVYMYIYMYYYYCKLAYLISSG